ncbi:MAG TPA: RNA polymerase sigma factor [Gemmatimonadales bacterium]
MSPFEATRAAFAFARMRGELVRYVTNYTGNPDAAEDVVQEVYLRLHEKPPADLSRLRSWLYAVATNVARDDVRTARRRADILRREVNQVPLPTPAPDPAVAVERADLRGRLRVAMEVLTARERTALLMREEGFRHREIAEAVGTTTKTIGTLMARALEKVHRQLNKEEA